MKTSKEGYTKHNSGINLNDYNNSLAEERKENAICIIFSGTGTDGTIGLREIKGAGGMVIILFISSFKFML